MKKIFFALLLLASPTWLAANETVIERPPFSVCAQNSIEIDKIVLNDTATIMYMTSYYERGWFRIDSQTYIRANGQKQVVQRAEGIELNKETWPDKKTKKHSYVLFFPPIAPDTKQIDWIESDCNDCFKIWGIELQSNTLTDRKEVPKKIRNAAEQKDMRRLLPVPKFKYGEATLKGYLLGYVPEMGGNIKVYVNNPLTQQIDITTKFAPDGSFELKIPLATTMAVGILSRFPLSKILLSPGEESSVYIDLQQIAMQESRTRIDKTEESRCIYFAGANAALNNELENMKIHYIDYNKMYSDVLGKSAMQYRQYILNWMNEQKAEIMANPHYSSNVKE